MRVIAGLYRSRSLAAPRGTGTRPTSDRLRETLFNILAPRVPGARCADLYAGTGAVGIEALSRGAAHVWFAERAPTAIAAIRGNLSSLGVAHGFSLEGRGTGALLQKLGDDRLSRPGGTPSPKPDGLLDLVFLDPPWEAKAEYTATLHLLGSVRGSAMLARDALVIVEHSSKVPLAAAFGALSQTRTLKQGDAALTFYALGLPVG